MSFHPSAETPFPRVYNKKDGGYEMAYKFDPKNMKKLDSAWRREVLPPEETLKILGLTAADTVADIGCGIGYFTIPASKISKDNSIYALDTSQEMLDYLGQNNSSTNIILVNTDAYDFKINDSIVDFALLVNVFHEIDDKKTFIKEIVRILKPGGRLAVIEWQKKDTGKGPDKNHRIAPNELKEILKQNFNAIKTVDFGEYFYGTLFIAI